MTAFTRASCLIAACALGCTTQDVDVPLDDATSTSSSSAATSSQTSAQSSTASSTTGASQCDPAEACKPRVIETPKLLSFGNDDRFEGGTFSYSTDIHNEVTDAEEWHISGTVNTWSGFGVAFPCVSDASAFRGVKFTIRGDVGSNRLALSANTASNSKASDNTCEQAHSTCTGGCANSEAAIELTDDLQTISLEWGDFSGGSPNDQPDPSELISLVWVFGWSMGATPYEVDVTVDDIEFLE